MFWIRFHWFRIQHFRPIQIQGFKWTEIKENYSKRECLLWNFVSVPNLKVIRYFSVTKNAQIFRKNLQLTKKYDIFFFIKNCIYLSLGPHKGRSSYWRSLQPTKENIQHFKTWSFLTFFYFCGSFLPSRIRILIMMPTWLNPDPDPKHCLLE